VRHVVAGVPAVDLRVLVEREDAPMLRVQNVRPCRVRYPYTSTQRRCRPSSRFSERSIGSRASASSAQAFSSRLDRRVVFRERELHADEPFMWLSAT
jgi:hypothetical protein